MYVNEKVNSAFSKLRNMPRYIKNSISIHNAETRACTQTSTSAHKEGTMQTKGATIIISSTELSQTHDYTQQRMQPTDAGPTVSHNVIPVIAN